MGFLEIAEIIEALIGAGKSATDIAKYFRDRHAESVVTSAPAPSEKAEGGPVEIANPLGNPDAPE